MKNLCPTEFQEQCTVIDFLELMLRSKKILAFTAIPQNMWTTSWKQKWTQKREGVRKGFPDIVVVTNKTVLFIEMKRVKGGEVQPEQKNWHDILGGKQSVSAICYGAKPAMDLIEQQIKSE